MLKHILALLLLAPSSATAQSGPQPLCRVVAVSYSIPIPPLRSLTLTLRPGCPPNGHADVRLHSSSGATDPAYGFNLLTPDTPTITYSGVLSNWLAEWQDASGRTWHVRENLP